MSKRQEQMTAEDRQKLELKLEEAKARMRSEGTFSDEHNVPVALVHEKQVLTFGKRSGGA